MVSVKPWPPAHVLLQRSTVARADMGFSCRHFLYPDHHTSHLCVHRSRGNWRVVGCGEGAAMTAYMSTAAVEHGGLVHQVWVQIPTCHLISV